MVCDYYQHVLWSAKQLLLQLTSLVYSKACAIPIKITKPKLHDKGKTLFLFKIKSKYENNEENLLFISYLPFYCRD